MAALSARVGVHLLENVEDAVQSSLMTALQAWTTGTVPDDPSAWLFRVAHNRLLGDLRTGSNRRRILERHGAGQVGGEHAFEPAQAHFEGEIEDDLLRMLFACCDDANPPESQLVLALHTLCGFDVREIAHRLFVTEATAYKRLGRAKKRLCSETGFWAEFDSEHCAARLPTVRTVLYLMFTEGHLSSHPERAIRRELCDEALRLATLLAEHPTGAHPETFALVALMHLHAARTGGRLDAGGGLLLLEEQDRSEWDQTQIAVGLEWLARSAAGDHFSRYHAEAAVAAEHCLAPSLAQTRWDRIASNYALLERQAPSPLHRLGRALAVAELEGPEAALGLLDEVSAPSRVSSSYLWCAVLGDLYRRSGNRKAADQCIRAALDAAPSPAIRTLLERRLGRPGR